MIKKIIKNKSVILFLIFLAALVVRGAVLYVVYDEEYLMGIKSGSDAIGRSIVEGNGFSRAGKPDLHDLPGYPVLVAFTYFISGQTESDVYLQILQIFFSALTVFLIYAISKRFFNEKISLLASFLWIFWFPETRIAAAPVHDYPVIFLTVLGFYFFVRGVFEKKNILFILFGIFIGLASYVRSDPMLLPIVGGFVLWVYLKDFKYALKATVLSMGMVLLVLLPWGVRNYKVIGEFSMLRSVLWQGVWEGFGEFPNPFGAVLSDGITYYQIEAEHPGIAYDSSAYQQILKQKSIAAIKRYPGWYLMMLPKRLFMMIFAPRNFGLSYFVDPQFARQSFFEKNPGEGNIDYVRWLFENNAREFILRVGIIANFQLIVVALSAAGFWFYRQEWRKNLILMSPWIYFYFSHLPIYWESRYLVPGEFPYLIFSSAAILYLWSIFKIKMRGMEFGIARFKL